MTTFDLSPLLRSSVGFDAFDNIFDTVFNMNETGSAYPPYNIVKSGNNYTITLAVAGFSMSDLDISVQENELIISGKTNDSENNLEFLHKGIAGRSFERKFASGCRTEGAHHAGVGTKQALAAADPTALRASPATVPALFGTGPEESKIDNSWGGKGLYR